MSARTADWLSHGFAEKGDGVIGIVYDNDPSPVSFVAEPTFDKLQFVGLRRILLHKPKPVRDVLIAFLESG